MENKAAYYQAELQIAAGIRRLEKAFKFLNNQNWNGNRYADEASFRLSEAIDEASKALREVRRQKNDTE